jgi:hypothetical protein
MGKKENKTMDHDVLIEQIESVLGETKDGVPIFLVRRTEPEGDAVWFEKITRIASAIERFSPPRSVYLLMMNQALENHDPPKNSKQTTERLKAVLMALKEDLAEQRLQKTAEIIHSDMLSDFLEMAMRFVRDGFKDPAAILAGSVLAEHLRRLLTKNEMNLFCDNEGEPIPKNLTRMNQELFHFEVYEKATQQNITAWNEIRLNALYGHYDKFTHEQAKNMVSGLRLLITAHPA